MLSSHELSVRVQTLNRNSYQHPVNLAWEIGYTACSETTLSTTVLLNGFLLTDAILSPYEAGASLTDTINNEVLPALKRHCWKKELPELLLSYTQAQQT